jgi:3-dehydroquinate dehydratase-2
MKKIAVINGPNINMLGARPTSIYGSHNYDDLLKICYDEAAKHHLAIEVFQTNIEGEIVSLIQEMHLKYHGIIINPAAYCHTSIAIFDSLEIVKIPIIEVHLSNISQREEFRQKSFTAKAAKGVISGFGIDSYRLAIIMMRDLVE